MSDTGAAAHTRQDDSFTSLNTIGYIIVDCKDTTIVDCQDTIGHRRLSGYNISRLPGYHSRFPGYNYNGVD